MYNQSQITQIVLYVFEAFAGYGSQSLALIILSMIYPFFTFIVVGIAEFEDFVFQAYQILHGTDIKNYGDIKGINWEQVPNFNLFTYSFPCQDLSKNGKRKGLKEKSNTRSASVWDCLPGIKAKEPKFLLMENVDNILSKEFEKDFKEWMKSLEELGYVNCYFVLDAANFGIPQHRERCFMISIKCKEDERDQCEKQLKLMAEELSNIKQDIQPINNFLSTDVPEGYYLTNYYGTEK